MLLQLGSVSFEVLPFNVHELDHGTSARYAEKPVLGTRPPLEFIGPGPEEWSIKAVLFPHEYGGDSNLSKLFQMLNAGRPQYMVRGDGKTLGWMSLQDVQEGHTWLDQWGVAQRIDVDIKVKRTGGPGGGSYFSVISGLL